MFHNIATSRFTSSTSVFHKKRKGQIMIRFLLFLLGFFSLFLRYRDYLIHTLPISQCHNQFLFLTNWHDKKMNCPICLDEDDKYDEYD